jgi:hypothetical protein
MSEQQEGQTEQSWWDETVQSVEDTWTEMVADETGTDVAVPTTPAESTSTDSPGDGEPAQEAEVPYLYHEESAEETQSEDQSNVEEAERQVAAAAAAIDGAMDTVSSCRGPSDVFEDLDPGIAACDAAGAAAWQAYIALQDAGQYAEGAYAAYNACQDARQALTEAKISLVEERADGAIDTALNQLMTAKGHLGY